MSDAEPSSAPQWTWDGTRGKEYMLIADAYHYRDGTVIPLVPSGQATETKHVEGKIAKASEEDAKRAVLEPGAENPRKGQKEEEEEESPPAYENVGASIWCTKHQNWYQDLTDYEEHVDDAIHETCGVHGCNVNGKPFASAGDCSIHMKQAHFCTVHGKFVANWTDHLMEAKHYRCGVNGCMSNWSRAKGYKYVVEDYRRHFKKHHLTRDGYVAGCINGPGQERAEICQRHQLLRHENFQYYQSHW